MNLVFATAVEVLDAYLEQITKHNHKLNAIAFLQYLPK